jgi:hypothetical protein
MRTVLQPEEQGQLANATTTERRGRKRVDTDTLPGYRLNTSEKYNMSSTYFPLFQGKARHDDIVTPTQVDAVVFQARSLTPNAKTEGKRTYETTVKKGEVHSAIREAGHVTPRDMVENYRNSVARNNRTASQMPPTRRTADLGELLSIGNFATIGGERGSAVIQSVTPTIKKEPILVGNPNSYKHGRNRKNASTIFTQVLA